ncbi:MAG TPA: hypothetical protein VE177_01965, partial [Candidatus Binatus sp.]|nr:hypothetical protein [Candidatus Binatus sp.]
MRNPGKRSIFLFMISIFILAGFVRPAYAAITLVGSAIGTGDVSASAPAISVSAGDTVVAIAGAQTGSVVFSDSETDTPTLVTTQADSGTTVFEQMSYFTVATTSTTYTVTATFTCGSCSAANRNALVVLVYRGVTSVGSNVATTGSSTNPSVVLTTAASGDYAVAGFSWRGNTADCTTGLVGNDRNIQPSAGSASRVTASGFDNTGSTSVTNAECLSTS